MSHLMMVKTFLMESKIGWRNNSGVIFSFNFEINRNIFLEPPPLPATLPPVGSHMKQSRVSTTSISYTSGPNVNNNTETTMRSTTSWHVQTQHLGANNNGDSTLTHQMVTNNNFLDNERAASAIAAG